MFNFTQYTLNNLMRQIETSLNTLLNGNKLNGFDEDEMDDVKYLCVSSKIIQDDTSDTVTSFYGGSFSNPFKFAEFQNYLKD